MSYNPDDHFSSGCWPRTTRRSTPNTTGTANTGGRRGFFSNLQGGRTVLPPLHLPFRSSRSPAPDQNFSGNQYAQQEGFHSQNDFNIHSHGQSQWPSNSNLPQSHQSSSLASDSRYHTQYSSYPSRTSQPIPGDPHDPHLSSSQQLYSGIPHSQQAMTPASHIRSPTGYSTNFASNQQQQMHAAAYGYPAPDARNLPPPIPQAQYDPTTGAPIPRRPSMSVDRTVPSRVSVHAPSPYARQPPQMSSTYNPEPEPMIKKKRKRADAEQLKVLNETYARTAFPSTEERIELAKKLGMSARSVQIWFQNKRQSMRQSTRQASTHAAPPTTTEPFTATVQSAHIPPQAGGGGSYHPTPSAPMGSASMGGQAYGSQRSAEQAYSNFGRPGPSPTPSGHRGRSHDSDPRRPPSRAPY
ncbi:homeobox-domain-containing protein [Cristinia sonorae]|uniref:Homeobox-domain-containing protein n=1 Tax=Cristinia sonorae TaxID=1940300 RepID=A0A8K0UXZ8_9AGAR|nr:homeobox-domain-containing protein [Cristinia sonorae]